MTLSAAMVAAATSSAVGVGGPLYEFTVTTAQAAISIPTAGFPAGALRIELSAKSTGGNNLTHVRFNSDVGTNYVSSFASVDAAAVLGGSSQDGIGTVSIRGLNVRPSTASNFQTGIYIVSEWDASDRFTDVNGQGFSGSTNTDGDTETTVMSGQWRNNAVVTTIDLAAGSGLFDVGTRVRVYSAASPGGVPTGTSVLTSLQTDNYLASVGEVVLWAPSAPGKTVTAPVNPQVGATFGILKSTDTVDSWNVDGNGNDIYDPNQAGVWVSAPFSVAGAASVNLNYVYDGTRWSLATIPGSGGDSGGGGSLTATDTKAGAYTGASGERVRYNASSAFALTTPSSRSDKDELAFHSVTTGEFPITITADGSDLVANPDNFGIPEASFVVTDAFFHVHYQFDSVSNAWLIL